MAHLSVYFSLENAGGSQQRARLKQGLDTLPGVTSVSINDRGCLAVDYDSTGVRQEDIRRKILELGFSIQQEESKPPVEPVV